MKYYIEYEVGSIPYIADEVAHNKNIKCERDNENFITAEEMKRYRCVESFKEAKAILVRNYRGDRDDASRALQYLRGLKK